MQNFDVAILGGGISGLYLAHKILKRDSNKKVIIVEKGRTFGGRVESYQDKWMSVEAGAGRIHSKHKLTLALIRELGLESKLIPIDNNGRFADNGMLLPQPHVNIMAQVARASRRRTKHELMEKTLFEFTKEICGEEDAITALSSFGYATEFLHMNAYDAIALMGIIATPQKYYVLSGGLTQIIERLVAELEKMGCYLEPGRTVEGVSCCVEGRYKIYSSSSLWSIEASRCVCTFPAKNVASLRISGNTEFRLWMAEWKRIIKASIYGGALCRIYSRFDLVNGKPWFAGLGRITMKNDIRYIIPMNEKTGVIMISYTDGSVADKWGKLESDCGIRCVNQRLKKLVDEGLGVSIPPPKHTRVFYWSNGVGYWRVGADSALVEKTATKGFRGMYFCGENYSSKNQQWIEGSLDTADMTFAGFFRPI